jgi:hypothetical protein
VANPDAAAMNKSIIHKHFTIPLIYNISKELLISNDLQEKLI